MQNISWRIIEIALRRMPQNLANEKISCNSGNGLVLSGNKLLPDPMLTKIYSPYGIATHSPGRNELI